MVCIVAQRVLLVSPAMVAKAVLRLVLLLPLLALVKLVWWPTCRVVVSRDERVEVALQLVRPHSLHANAASIVAAHTLLGQALGAALEWKERASALVAGLGVEFPHASVLLIHFVLGLLLLNHSLAEGEGVLALAHVLWRRLLHHEVVAFLAPLEVITVAKAVVVEALRVVAQCCEELIRLLALSLALIKRAEARAHT